MRIDLHIYNAPDAEMSHFMKLVLSALNHLKEGHRHMSEAQDRFTRELGELKQSVTDAATKIGELAEIVRNNPGNEALLNDAADQMDTMEAQLAAAGAPPAEPPADEPAGDGA